MDKEEIRAVIEEAVIGIDLSNVEDDERFEEIGIDSLDHASILLIVEEKSGKKIPDEALQECSSIAGIVSFLKDA